MRSYRKICDRCEKPIQIRQRPDGSWAPFEEDGTRHDCPGLQRPVAPAPRPVGAGDHPGRPDPFAGLDFQDVRIGRPAGQPPPPVAGPSPPGPPRPPSRTGATPGPAWGGSPRQGYVARPQGASGAGRGEEKAGRTWLYLLVVGAVALGIFWLRSQASDPVPEPRLPAAATSVAPRTPARTAGGAATRTAVARVATATFSPRATAPPVVVGDRDCDAFAAHARAQEFYEANGGPAHDPHRLDRDRDGVACETLP